MRTTAKEKWRPKGRLEVYWMQRGGPSLPQFEFEHKHFTREELVDLLEEAILRGVPKSWTKAQIISRLYQHNALQHLTPRQKRRWRHKTRHLAAAGRNRRPKFRLKLGAWNRRRR